MKIIYCDGSSLGNPGNSGYGVVALDFKKGLVWEFGENTGKKTNNQAELYGCIFTLKLVLNSFKKNSDSNMFELRLDSQYVIKGSTEWVRNWSKNGWKNSQKKDVENKDLWQEILDLLNEIKEKNITLRWAHVYGHTGEKWNERVDEIAKNFAADKPMELRLGQKF